MRALNASSLVAALLIAACSSSPTPAPPLAARAPAPVSRAETPLPGLARYLYVDRLGSIFDEAAIPSELPRTEPALLDGLRALVSGGFVLAHAPAPEKLQGFRSLPERLGGGYVLWSQARTYRARTFLGELEPITDTPATGGARPWLQTFLLRTPVGVLEVDPGTLRAQRVASPGLAEALALDAGHGIRLDLLGRAAFTTDAAAFTDLLQQRGESFSTLSQGPTGELLLGTPGAGPSLRLLRSGLLEASRDGSSRPPARPPGAQNSIPELSVAPLTGPSLPGELLAHAAASGALLRASPTRCTEPSALCAPSPGSRMLVARPGGLRLFSADTSFPLVDADLLAVDERFARCQPRALTAALPPLPGAFSSWPSEQILLACTGDTGAAVLALPQTLARPRLQITFPEPGTFVAGPNDRLAFTGRCGPLPPGPGDLGPSEPGAGNPPGEEEPASGVASAMPLLPAPPEPIPLDSPAPGPAPADDVRLCLRRSADHWIERRASGPSIRHFYRWVLGDGGQVSALLLEKSAPSAPPEAVVSEGVGLIRIDPADPALRGGVFPAVRAAQKEAPYRSIDEDFWQDEDGAVRGWLLLPAEGDAEPRPPPSAEDTAGRTLPVDPRRGGRSAGLRITPSGTIELFPLPPGVRQVVSGGRFALALAIVEGKERYHESRDGGRSWIPTQGPPTGRIEPPVLDSAPFGCSILGCALGGGVVRLGWGGPPPAPDAGEPPFTPAANPLIRPPRPPKLRCHFDSLDEPLSSEQGPARKRPPMIVGKPASPPGARPPTKRSAPSKGPSAAGKSASPSLLDKIAAPPPPISLHLAPSSPMGALDAQGWKGEVWLPYQPQASLQRLSIPKSPLTPGGGLVIPVLRGSSSEPVDLLLQMGKYHLRAGEGRSVQRFDAPAKPTIAADLPEGSMLLLDPDKGVLWITRAEARSAVLRLLRVPDVSRTRLTLGRRLDGKGMSLIGYSTGTGEVFAGEIDLGRAEVGPLSALGRIETLAGPEIAACAGAGLSQRFLAELPVVIEVLGKKNRPLLEQELGATLLVEGNGEQLCLRGLEVGLVRGGEVSLTVQLGKPGGAALRRDREKVAGSCSLVKGR